MISIALRRLVRFSLLLPAIVEPSVVGAQVKSDPRIDRFKTEIARAIDGRAKLGQQMVDQV